LFYCRKIFLNLDKRVVTMVNIHIAEHSGTCYGVERALEIARDQEGKKVYTLGSLIHNKRVIEDLEKKGVKYIEDISGISSGKVIIRAHGVGPKIIREIKAKGLEVIDATCPYVKKVHNLAKKLDKDYQLVILGEKEHPEVVGIKGYAEKSIVVENLEDAEKLGEYEKIGLVSQTTQSKEKLDKIILELEKHTKYLKVYNTICDATVKRQDSAINLAKKVELMIVLGGYNSGNTRRLAELCNEYVETYHIESFLDLDKKVLEGKEEIGLTAGASTPDNQIKEIVKNLEGHYS